MNATETGHRVTFRSGHAPVQLEAGANPAEHLSCENSPVLFGCRTGICGTCMSRVEVLGSGNLEEADQEEKDLLHLLCPQEPKARLLCQLRLTSDILVEPLKH